LQPYESLDIFVPDPPSDIQSWLRDIVTKYEVYELIRVGIFYGENDLHAHRIEVLSHKYGVVSMDVQPKTWSDSVEAGKSKSQTFTVSATGGTVKGVTVAKLSGPGWITVSPTSLGDISADSSKTFTVTASPPAGTSGSFDYSIRVSCAEGEPKSIDITGTITVSPPPPSDTTPPQPAETKVEPGIIIRDDYQGSIRFKVYWRDDKNIAKVKFEFWADSINIGVKDPSGRDVDANGNGWYWCDIPRAEWAKYVGKKIYWHSVAWDFANNWGDTNIQGPLSIVPSPPLDTTPPSVMVISPNGGEVWKADELQRITWRATDDVGVTRVDIYYSTDGGRSWSPVALSISNTGSYDWRVPSTPSTNCLVRIDAYDEAGNKGSDTSDAPFTISPIVLRGDINHDGKVDAADWVLMKQILLGRLSPETCGWAADMNGDGVLNAIDVVMLKQKLLRGE